VVTVRTMCLIIQNVTFVHAMYLCILCDCHDKQPLFLYIALTDRFFITETECFLWDRNWSFIYYFG